MARLREGKPNRICLHHAGVDGVPADLTALKKRLAGYEITHSKKTWAETIKTGGEYGYYYLEYHIAIAGNGHELRLQDDKYVLYHAGDNDRGTESFNLHGIAVLIDGNYMNDKPNALQLEAFARVIARFEKQYKVDVLVRGHKQTSLTGTSCPGMNLGDNTKGFLKDAITRANAIVKGNLPTNPLQDDVVVPEPIDYQKEIDRLEEVIVQREAQLVVAGKELEEASGKLKMVSDRVDFLEATLAVREAEMKELEEENSRLVGDKDRFEKQYMEVVAELNGLKKGRDDWINRLADVLHKLFGMK